MSLRGAAALVGCLALGCGGSAASRELKVSAAMSLKEVFTEVAAGFEAEHPGVDVVFNFAGTQILAGKIEEGAPVDVFASAAEPQMQRAIASGRVAAAERYASNRLVLISPATAPIVGPAIWRGRGCAWCWPGPGCRRGATRARRCRSWGSRRRRWRTWCRTRRTCAGWSAR